MAGAASPADAHSMRSVHGVTQLAGRRCAHLASQPDATVGPCVAPLRGTAALHCSCQQSPRGGPASVRARARSSAVGRPPSLGGVDPSSGADRARARAVLCGNNGDSCWAKYGAYPLHRPYCHEMALRIVLASLEGHANRYKRHIVPVRGWRPRAAALAWTYRIRESPLSVLTQVVCTASRLPRSLPGMQQARSCCARVLPLPCGHAG
jgi:hypothetical protein